MSQSPPIFEPRDLTNGAVTVAGSQIGVIETGPNSGPEVNEYLAAVGHDPGDSWCAAFVYWCFARASEALELLNPCPRTAGVLRMFERSPERARTQVPNRGAIITMDHGKGKGHTGLVEEVHGGGLITTIEGNTNRAGSRQGNAVARHTWRPGDGARGTLVGYIDFSLVPLASRKPSVA